MTPDLKLPAVYWLRRDFRLKDNLALRAANKHDSFVVVYALDDSITYGSAAKVLLHGNLEVFSKLLSSLDQELVVHSGSFKDLLSKLIIKNKLGGLYYNHTYEPELLACDKKIKEICKKSDIYCEGFPGNLIHEPHLVNKKDGTPYLVYSAFYKNAVGTLRFQTLAAPKSLKPQAELKGLKSVKIKSLGLIPKISWHKGFKLENIGEEKALKAMNGFIKSKVHNYNSSRDIPSVAGTSRLSHFFSFGNLTPARAIAALLKADPKLGSSDTLQYHKEIYWREFSYHLLINHPKTINTPLNEKFKNYPWKKNTKHLRAWKRGLTGFPIVDAGMRELWTTGYMHNRVRMIVASFLIKDLHIHWKEGERYFWDCLTDADLAANVMGWQWVSGGGADAAPFFRIFNPTTQSQKFDPEGVYIKRFVPELKELDKKWVHEPANAPEKILEEAGIKLGLDYPKPVVDHAEERMTALMNYERFVKSK